MARIVAKKFDAKYALKNLPLACLALVIWGLAIIASTVCPPLRRQTLIG